MKHLGLLDLNEAVQYPGKKLVFSIETELPQEEDLDLIEPLVGSIEAVSTGNALLLKGHFKTRCVLECARCSEPLEQDIEFSMEDDFLVEGIPSSYASDGYAEVVFEEPLPLFKGNQLDVDIYARQGLIINTPNQPLCAFGWDGPCPNAKFHTQKPESGHPAMRLLEQFRHEENE